MRRCRHLEVRLAGKDKKRLKELVRGGIQPVRVVLRALALLQLSDGRTAPRVAGNVRLTAKGVREIGWRYCQEGMDRALSDKQRPSAQPVLDNGQRQRIVALVCSDPPEGRSRWTVAF